MVRAHIAALSSAKTGARASGHCLELGFEQSIRLLDRRYPARGVRDAATSTQALELRASLRQHRGPEHGARALDHMRTPFHRLSVAAPRGLTECGKSCRRLVEEGHDDLVERLVTSEIVPELLQHGVLNSRLPGSFGARRVA